MKVNELAIFFDGLSQGLRGLSKSTSDSLHALRSGLQPFEDKTIEQFVGFLVDCKRYQEDGIIPGGKRTTTPKTATPKSNLSVEDAVAKVQKLLDTIKHGNGTTAAIDETIAMLDKGLTKAQIDELLPKLDLAGKGKSKKDSLTKLRGVLNAQFEMESKSRNFHA